LTNNEPSIEITLKLEEKIKGGKIIKYLLSIRKENNCSQQKTV